MPSSEIVTEIKPAPGGDGPYYVKTEKDTVVTNVTTGILTIALAIDQMKADQGAALTGLTFKEAEVRTIGTS